MSLRAYRTFQALILAALGIFLMSKIMDGRILLYINQRFVLLVLLAALGLIFLAQLVLSERPALQDDPEGLEHPGHDHSGCDHTCHDHSHEAGEQRQGWVLWLVALPLFIGVLVPERPLGVSALENRGINTNANMSVRGGASLALQIPSTQRTVLDWLRVFNESTDSQAYESQPADVTGFVYHDARLEGSHFMVGRFTLACCVADATALGMVVDWPEAAALSDNRWVRVRGPVSTFNLDGRNLPLIKAEQVEVIPQPEQPYLFP